jgi:hypothetical protein
MDMGILDDIVGGILALERRLRAGDGFALHHEACSG